MRSSGGPCEVLIADMQPIQPAVGGGRLRVLGLYHALGPGLRARYFGTCDWPGAPFRRHPLSPELEETDVPLSPAHWAAHARWTAHVGGRVLLDTTFDWLGQSSAGFVGQGRLAAAGADVVIFSHPWVYPLLRGALRPEQMVIYDSHNCEAVLRAQLWDDGAAGTELARHVALVERELARRADLTLVCSADDAEQLGRLHGLEGHRLLEVPNGVFTGTIRPPTAQEREASRARLGLGGTVAIFIGSPYGPNLEAVELIARRVAPALQETTFVVAGGISSTAEAKALAAGAANVRLTGPLSDEERTWWLHAADLGINPMLSGSGTNIKMFDFMAAGLPVIATPTGARGIAPCEGVAIAEPESLAGALRTWSADPALRARGGAAARQLACERYSWEQISPRLGALVLERWREKPGAAPSRPVPSRLRVVAPVLATAPAGQTPPAPARRIAVVSTWNAQCGVAEYMRYLSTALSARGVESLVVNGAVPPVRLTRADAADAPVLRVEDMAPRFGSDGGAIAAACQAAGVNQLLVQYHSAFFSEEALRSMVVACRLAGIRVAVTCHDGRRMSAGGLARISRAGARLLVHNHDELVRLTELGVDQAEYVALGVHDLADRPAAEARTALGWDDGPVVATFGFLRPHKGLAETIQAFGLVRDAFPSARLLALTALYPSADSREYLQRCTGLLRSNGLAADPGVRLETAFLPIQEVVERLHAADVVILPYHHSDEGASASAAIALAARRPVITTPSPIFDDLAAYTYQTGSVDPFCLALAICNVLASGELRESLLERSCAFVESRSWARVAARYEALLFSPRRWRPPPGARCPEAPAQAHGLTPSTT